MRNDWNVEEVNNLKIRAFAHNEDKVVMRHLEHLDLHLKNHSQCLLVELRGRIWQTVEEWASKLDQLLGSLKT